MNEADRELCEVHELHPDRLNTVQTQLPDEEQLMDLAELFKIFGDTTRIKILYVLFESAAQPYMDPKKPSLNPIDRAFILQGF